MLIFCSLNLSPMHKFQINYLSIGFVEYRYTRNLSMWEENVIKRDSYQTNGKLLGKFLLNISIVFSEKDAYASK